MVFEYFQYGFLVRTDNSDLGSVYFEPQLQNSVCSYDNDRLEGQAETDGLELGDVMYQELRRYNRFRKCEVHGWITDRIFASFIFQP